MLEYLPLLKSRLKGRKILKSVSGGVSNVVALRITFSFLETIGVNINLGFVNAPKG
jgi:hypothetical protein